MHHIAVHALEQYPFRSAPAEAGDNLVRFRRGEKQDGLPPRGLPVYLTHKKPALNLASWKQDFGQQPAYCSA